MRVRVEDVKMADGRALAKILLVTGGQDEGVWIELHRIRFS